MKRLLLKPLMGTALGLFLATASCVSVKLPQAEFKKAEDVRHAPMSKDFQPMITDHVDKAWRHEKSGNVVSYYTECEIENVPSYQNVKKGLLRSINEASVERELNVRVSGETALRSVVSGKVDGKLSIIDLIIFEKNSCVFILTYVGPKDKFLLNQQDYENFFSSFEVIP